MAYGYLLIMNAELGAGTGPRGPQSLDPCFLAAALLPVLIFRTVLPTTTRVSVLQALYFRQGFFALSL